MVVVDRGLQDEQIGNWNMIFINFEKVFDSIDREVLWKLLYCYGIFGKYINFIQIIFDNCS